MSVSAVSSNGLSGYSSQDSIQQMQKEFQQLGQDLQSGNLSAAQSDFVTLQSIAPQSASSSSQSGSQIQQEFSALGQDLQSGNLSAAQQAYTKIQQSFQSQASQSQQEPKVGGGHHHHHGGGGSSEVSQLMDQLGTDLQSGNLTAAQQAYTSLQSDFQQASSNNGAGSFGLSTSSASSLSVNA
jgi:outer membrane protein assembly factor BamD (BamD/ComL family)